MLYDVLAMTFRLQISKKLSVIKLVTLTIYIKYVNVTLYTITRIVSRIGLTAWVRAERCEKFRAEFKPEMRPY